MKRLGRTSICYIDAGRDFRPGSSHTRQVLTLARALAPDLDVTVVFRRLDGDPDPAGCPVLALEPGRAGSGRGVASRRSVGRFLERRAADFGMVFEAGWPRPGQLSAWCEQRGVPALPILEGLPDTWLGRFDPGTPWLGFGSSGRYLRRAPVVIAATREIRDTIVRRWRVDPARVMVIGPAIDRTLFAARDRLEARRRLGIDAGHRVVVVADGLGRGLDLRPLVEAVPRAGDPELRLHVLGEGQRREVLQRVAGPGVRFYGVVGDELLAQHLAAADLCVLFDGSPDPAFTLLECASSARPVVLAVSANRIPPPLQHPATGFVVPHDLLSWIRFLQRDCPSRNALQSMGLGMGNTPVEHARGTAASYLGAIDRALAATARPPTLA